MTEDSTAKRTAGSQDRHSYAWRPFQDRRAWCGGEAEVFTQSGEANLANDGDSARCEDCHCQGVVSADGLGEELIDIREVWQLGDRQAHGSLDKIARHIDLVGKTCSGELFHWLYAGDKAAAMAYLKNDVELTEAVGKRIGVI